MLVLSMHPGEAVTVDAYTVALCELDGERVRLAVNATGAQRVRLMPEDIAVASRVTLWRRLQEQIHIDDDIQIWVIRLEANHVRIGFEAARHRQIVRECLTRDDLDSY
ncbi:MAG: carbon storage regulator [Planctomycetaceae bacterium]|nr:carbon storage regulator [Planctomycetaceae bacterium]